MPTPIPAGPPTVAPIPMLTADIRDPNTCLGRQDVVSYREEVEAVVRARKAAGTLPSGVTEVMDRMPLVPRGYPDLACGVLSEAATLLATGESQSKIQATPTIRPIATPAPTPTPDPSIPMYGPTSGQIIHEPGDGNVETFWGVKTSDDILAEVTFLNPPNVDKWRNGFFLRNSRSGRYHSISIRSDGSWIHQVRLGRDSSRVDLRRERTSNIDKTNHGRNRLRLITVGDDAWLFINGEFEGKLDLSQVTDTAPVKIYVSDESTGVTTRFESFTIWKWSPELAAIPVSTQVPTPSPIPTSTPTPIPTPAPTPVTLPTTTPTVRVGIEGRFLFNTDPITNFTQRYPLFRVKERNSQQTCADVNSNPWRTVFPTYNDTTGTYVLTGLEAGYYCHLVNFDAAEPFDGKPIFPGDFISGSGYGSELSLLPGETKTVDLVFLQFIHLISPVDNSSNLISALVPGNEVASPVQVTWDPIPGAQVYSLLIRACGDPVCTVPETFFRGNTQRNQVEVNLPPIDESRNYAVWMRAYNASGEIIGKLWGIYGSQALDGAPFRVAAPAP